MINNDKLNITFSGKIIAKNTVYNLLGNVIPIMFAIVFIPPLIKGLGNERFGILSIAWMIIGYFSFFDFGIARGLTKIVAERIGANATEQIPKIFWTSIFFIALVSLIISIGLYFLIPSLANIFKISKNLQPETVKIFYILALSIPLVTTMAGLRGFLEAYQKFATISIMRTILGIFTFLGPLLVLIITNSLFWIIVFLIFSRIIIWFLYLYNCIKTFQGVRNEIKIDIDSIKPVLKFSMWITIGNILVPIIFYSDRFLIGALISAAAITFYVTPFEVVSRLMVIPSAMSGVLFPVFSASFLSNRDIAKKIFLRAVKLIFLIMYPSILLIMTFSHEGIYLWLGSEFASKSTLILQLLALGVFMNSISLIPTNFFEGIGRPKIPTLIITVEVPLYLFSMWFAINHFGINGAAFVFMISASINATILYILAYKLYSIRFTSRRKEMIIVPFLLGFIFPFLMGDIYMKIIFTMVFVGFFPFVAWKYFLSAEEKLYVFSKLKLNTQ